MHPLLCPPCLKDIPAITPQSYSDRSVIERLVSVGADRHESDATVLAEIFAPVNYEDFMAVFIVTDFFPADLSQIIRSPQQLTDVHVQVRRVTRLRACRCVLCS